ncbi:DUF6916 family protein [Coralliovum pocilloporae]|uniref:DUF6916 family protein n=1 Tax=Coralliovum pocilloporae TaxID=3066369 RepID=UPI003306D2CB
MRNLNDMTAEDFADLEDTVFHITSLDPRISLQLIEVKKLGSGERKGGAFSLLWQGPSEPVLTQATYCLSQTAIGSHDMFLVPVAEKQAGIQYEAIFT